MISLCIGLLFYSAYSEHSTALENINNFKNKNVVLKCMSGGGFYSSSDSYRVSLSEGWKVSKNYFVKESFMVPASKCERW
jgi:hypothetical protein